MILREDVTIVVAIARNGVMGRQGQLPWRMRSDLRRFKSMTMGQTLIMGRKTWDSIGRPLPGRTTIVLSKSLTPPHPDVRIAHSIADALDMTPIDQRPCIVGGSEIYRQTLPLCQHLWLTHIEAEVEGDILFPQWTPSAWSLLERTTFAKEDGDDYDSTFEKWERVCQDSAE